MRDELKQQIARVYRWVMCFLYSYETLVENF